MIHPWWIVGVVAQTTCDGGQTLVLGLAVAEDKMPIVRDEDGGRIPYGTSTGSVHTRKEGPRETSPPLPWGRP